MQHSVYDKVSVMKTSTGNSTTLVPEMMVLRRSCLQKVTLASVIFALACGNDQRVPTAPTVVMPPPHSSAQRMCRLFLRMVRRLPCTSMFPLLIA